MDDTTEIQKMLKAQNIYTGTITPYQKNGGKKDYLLDNNRLLRMSKSPLDEQGKLQNVQSVPLAPHIHFSGSFVISDGTWNCLILDYIQGRDLWRMAQELSDDQKVKLGQDVAAFLNELHLITDEKYDIGHYVPTIARFAGSWKNGHMEYADWLTGKLSRMELDLESKKTIERALVYIQTNRDALDSQAGAKLLHNDLHPSNIIVDGNGNLAGVIDWECSQFGEADFELTNFFEWCITYPPEKGKPLEIVLQTMLANLPDIPPLDCLEKRMTIYQLEHELNQLVWHGRAQEEKRIRQMDDWLNGRVASFLNSWC